MSQATSKDGRYTVIVEASFRYEREDDEFPTGTQETYVVDNTTGEKLLVYAYTGGALNPVGDIFFSGDGEFAVFPIPQFTYDEYNDYYAVNLKTYQTQQISLRIIDDRKVTLSPDGSKLIFSGTEYSYEPMRLAFYFPSIPQFALPEISATKILPNIDGAATVGSTIDIKLGLRGITQASNQDKITLTLNSGGKAVYDAAASRPGEFYVFKYTVKPDDITTKLAIASVNLNGAVLKGEDGDPVVISSDLDLLPVKITVDGYTGSAASEDFRGTTGANSFEGLGGDDTYLVDNPGDQVFEDVGGGKDSVTTTISYALTRGSEIESLRISTTVKSANIDLTGNEYVQTLDGNAGNNVLDGGGGADILIGHAGDDTYIVDTPEDKVIEAPGQGNDTVITYRNYVLAAGQEIETLRLSPATGSQPFKLIGNAFRQTLVGNGGNNTLDGQGGADTMIGGRGNDTYGVENKSDRVVEAVGGGQDTIVTTVSYRLAAGQEIETLRLSSTTGRQNLILSGNEFGQTLRGNDGNNTLDGKGGADTLEGGAGNDIYVVDHARDRVFEGKGGGTDTVIANASWTLTAGQEVEKIQLASAGGTAKLNLTGNEYGQALYGNAGANVLDGKGGADTMVGRAGDDTYVVDNARDVVIEAAGEGHDTVVTSVSYQLAAGQAIEALRLSAGSAPRNPDLTGNAFGQALVGNDGANLLDGRGGADILTGGRGPDAFLFSTKLGPGNVDRITDFAPVDDTIRLLEDVFTALDAGPLAARAFKNISTGKVDADDRILYKQATGELFYDADGSGKGAAVKFAVLDNHAKLTHDDFFIV